jgi:hypothetical protein
MADSDIIVSLHLAIPFISMISLLLISFDIFFIIQSQGTLTEGGSLFNVFLLFSKH